MKELDPLEAPLRALILDRAVEKEAANLGLDASDAEGVLRVLAYDAVAVDVCSTWDPRWAIATAKRVGIELMAIVDEACPPKQPAAAKPEPKAKAKSKTKSSPASTREAKPTGASKPAKSRRKGAA